MISFSTLTVLVLMLSSADSNFLQGVVKRLDDRTNINATCNVYISRHLIRCDVKPHNDTIPTGALCSYLDSDGLHLESFVCDRGFLINIDHKSKGTRETHIIRKRLWGFIAAAVGAAVLICSMFCGHGSSGQKIIQQVVNKPPKISCETVRVEKEIVADILNETVTVVLGNPTTNDPEGQEVKVTKRGESPDSTYGNGLHVITYTASDDVGNQAVCEVSFRVTVIYCLENLYVENGRAVCSQWNQIYGTICNIICQTGYELSQSSDAMRTCDKVGDRGVWSPSNSVICRKKTCSEPQKPCNVNLYCPLGFAFESTCYQVCSQGFVTNKTEILVCNGNEWIGKIQACTDVQAPTFTRCPNVIRRFAEIDKTAVVSWDITVAKDNSNDADTCGAFSAVNIQQVSGRSPGSRFPIGYHEIEYSATDSSLNLAYCRFTVIVEGLSCQPLVVNDPFLFVKCPEGFMYGSTCSFHCFMSYQLIGDSVVKCEKDPKDYATAFWNWTNSTESYCKKLTCPTLPVPVGGALACSEALGNQICTMSCSDKYQVAKSTPIQYVCNDKQVWIQGIPPNCTDKVHPSNAYLPGELFYYYSGSCSDSTVQDGIKNSFVKAMKELSSKNGWSYICPAYCTVDGVSVTCGPLNGRRRRSTENQITVNFRVSSEWETDKDLWGNDDTLSALSSYLQNMVSNGTLDVAGVTTGNIAFGWITLSCPVGQEPVYDNDAKCVGCPPGKYLTNNECVDCARGFYQEKEYQINCTRCPSDQSTIATGSKSINDCQDMCTPGLFSNSGLAPCTPCPLGQYQNKQGSTICVPCPPSTFTLSSGSKNNASCRAMDVTIVSSNTAIDLQPLSNMISSFSLGLFIKCSNTSMGITIVLADFNIKIENRIRVFVTDQFSMTSTPTVNLMKWTHIIVTWNSATREANIYNGGENIGSYVFVSVSPQDVEIKTGSYMKILAITSGCSFTGLFLHNGVLSQSTIAYRSKSCDVTAENEVYSMKDIFIANKNGTEISQSSCDAIDECTSNPCGYNNQCFDKLNTYECICNGGYKGVNCEIPPDFCSSNICKNGATCLSHFTNYTCQCTTGFYGFFCGNEIIDGNWGSWIESACSKSCGSGQLTRVRYCNNPSPGTNGKDCAGSNMTEDICNTNRCPVCPHFSTIYQYKNSFSCNSTADAVTCKVTCQPGYTFMRDYQPLDVYECGLQTAFQWNARPQPCVASNSPLALEANVTVQYNVDCNDKEQLKTVLSDNLKELQCAQNSTCQVTTSTSGCSQISRKRRSTQSLEVTIQLYSDFAAYNLHLEDFYTNNIISPGLLQSINTYSDSAASILQLNNSNILTVDVNGKIYVADISSFNFTTNVKCPAGTIEQELLCADCPMGTYWYNGLCVMCPKGTYQNENGQLQCKACPDGFTTLYIASRNVTECSVQSVSSSSVATTMVSHHSAISTTETIQVPSNASSTSPTTHTLAAEHGNFKEIVIPIVAVVAIVVIVTVLIAVIKKIRKNIRKAQRSQSSKSLGSRASLNMVRPTFNTDKTFTDNLPDDVSYAQPPCLSAIRDYKTDRSPKQT